MKKKINRNLQVLNLGSTNQQKEKMHKNDRIIFCDISNKSTPEEETDDNKNYSFKLQDGDTIFCILKKRFSESKMEYIHPFEINKKGSKMRARGQLSISGWN